MTKSILITGCSSGIGLDAARTLSARGWQVFASCRAPDDCARLDAEGLSAPQLDYTDRATFAPALASILEATGGTLDAVFHNGAYAIPAPLEDVPAEAMDAAFQANFLGWHALTREILPIMRKQGHGRIVLNSSVLGFIGMKYRGAYCATKFALEGWADVLRLEMAPENIEVSLIEPGPIDTDFRKNAIRAFERWIDWEASPRADEYRATLLTKLYEGSGGNRFELPASAVTENSSMPSRLTSPARAISSPSPPMRWAC